MSYLLIKNKKPTQWIEWEIAMKKNVIIKPHNKDTLNEKDNSNKLYKEHVSVDKRL